MSLPNLTPIVIAGLGTVIALAAIFTKTESPELYAISSTAFAGAAGLAQKD